MLGIWNSPPVPSLHAFTRERRRGRAGNRSRMRGPVVNRDRRRAFRATLTRQRRGCKQAESHAREFDGVLLLVFKAFCTPVRGRGRAVWVSRGGNTTSMSFTVTQFHIRSKCTPPPFFLSPSFSFVHARKKEFLTAFWCYLINSNEFLLSPYHSAF